LFRPLAAGLRWRATFGALRRFGWAVLRRRFFMVCLSATRVPRAGMQSCHCEDRDALVVSCPPPGFGQAIVRPRARPQEGPGTDSSGSSGRSLCPLRMINRYRVNAAGASLGCFFRAIRARVAAHPPPLCARCRTCARRRPRAADGLSRPVRRLASSPVPHRWRPAARCL